MTTDIRMAKMEQEMHALALSKARPMPKLLTGMVTRTARTMHVPLGLTPGGQKWALRALHPCDETGADPMKIPDNGSSISAAGEMRTDFTITSRHGDVNWDLQVLCGPFVDVPILWRSKAATDPNWPQWRVGAVFSAANTGEFQFGDPGATPIILPANVSNPTLLRDTTQFRTAFRGVTLIPDCPAMFNKGIVTAGQFASKPETIMVQPSKHLQPTAGWETIEAIKISDVPRTPADILSKCPNATEWEFAEGAYIPLRFNDPAHQWSSSEGASWTPIGATGDTLTVTGKPILIGETDELDIINKKHFVSNFPDDESINGWNLVTTAGQINQQIGIVIMSGLPSQANLRVKVRAGVELVTTSKNLSSMFQSAPALADPSAITAVMSITDAMPPAFPHKFNSFGWLLPVVKRLADSILPSVIPWLSSKVLPHHKVTVSERES